jgi:hypothetical protein
MRASVGPSIISRLAGAVATLWLCGTGSAWAGGGGTDLSGINTSSTGLQGVCDFLAGFGVTISPCPQAPTITQAVLQIAAWDLVPTEMIRALNNIPLGGSVNAGNPSSPPVTPPITKFPVGADVLANLLPNLTPLAFIGPNAIGKTVTLSTNGTTLVTSNMLNFASTNGLVAGQNYSIVDTSGAISPATTLISFTGTTVTMSANAAGKINPGDKITLTPIATATQLSNPNVGALLYAVASGFSDSGGQPDTLFFLYEDLSRDNQTFNTGQTIAYLSLPLVDSSGGLVMTNLQVVATCNGGPASCLQVQAVGGMTLSAKQLSNLGIQFALVFAPSAFSPKPHAFFELAVPLRIKSDTDPLYFNNPIANVPIAASGFFKNEEAPAVGIGPAAAPLCNGPCTSTDLPLFSLCATLPDNSNGPGAHRQPAVAAYYAISTAGETLLSAPLPGFSTSVCPF